MTREEAIEILQYEAYFLYDDDDSYNRQAFDMAIEALEAQKWISCSERLPDKNGEYLVTTKGGEVYQDTLQFICQWDDCGDDVIAWMPLPKPYQEDDQ